MPSQGGNSPSSELQKLTLKKVHLYLHLSTVSNVSFCLFELLEFLCLAAKPSAPDTAPAAAAGNGANINQLLGIKGAKQETVSF